jgi:hypothetical protein
MKRLHSILTLTNPKLATVRPEAVMDASSSTSSKAPALFRAFIKSGELSFERELLNSRQSRPALL